MVAVREQMETEAEVHSSTRFNKRNKIKRGAVGRQLSEAS